MRSYALIPTNGRKSFYGKAIVTIDDKGNTILTSYSTIVAYKDAEGNFHRTSDTRSHTTSCHLGSFVDFYDSKEWYKKPLEPRP